MKTKARTDLTPQEVEAIMEALLAKLSSGEIEYPDQTVEVYQSAFDKMQRRLAALILPCIALLLLTGTASAQWRPAWKAARIMPEVPREYARGEPVRASDTLWWPAFQRWRPLRWLPTPK